MHGSINPFYNFLEECTKHPHPLSLLLSSIQKLEKNVLSPARAYPIVYSWIFHNLRSSLKTIQKSHKHRLNRRRHIHPPWKRPQTWRISKSTWAIKKTCKFLWNKNLVSNQSNNIFLALLARRSVKSTYITSTLVPFILSKNWNGSHRNKSFKNRFISARRPKVIKNSCSLT